MKKYLNKFLLFISPLGVGAFFSCHKETPIPSYIHIDKMIFNTNYSTEGSSSNKILDAWVYIDDNLVGVFELPRTFPVLYAGNHNIKIYAGIKEDGISETRIAYPFYDKYEKDVTLTQGQITTISPSVKYVPGITFEWMEDFEGVSHGICVGDGVTKDSIMKITSDPAEVFEGNGSGKVSITGGTYFGQTCSKSVLPHGGASVFLEMNYKCNTKFNVGIIGYDAGGSIQLQQIKITLVPTSSWNKIYINFSNEVTTSIASTKFSIFFSMLNNTDLSSSEFYLDNVKLIY